MSDSYTKLFQSITASTIVSEPVATRWLWVTMLALADRNGDVWASIPGLARIANVDIADTERALTCFLSPDPYSRTRDHDGRRIVEIGGGWRLLNHAKYRAVRSAEDRRGYMRQYMADYRQSGEGANRKQCKQMLAQLAGITPPAPTPDKEQKTLGRKEAPAGFVRFWSAYPSARREKKAEALKIWNQRGFEALADRIVAHVQTQAKTPGWQKDGGQFVPQPPAYLRGERWQDGEPLAGEPVAAQKTERERLIEEAVRYANQMVESKAWTPKRAQEHIEQVTAQAAAVGRRLE